MSFWFVQNFIRPFISREVPGWGKLYEFFIGDYRKDDQWSSVGPQVIIDKRYNLFRFLDLREWADRNFYFLKRWYDLPAQLVIDALVKEGSHVLDVGANYGHFTLAAAARSGQSGRVYAFEPNPGACARLRLHVDINRLSQVRIHSMGFADEEGELVLSIPSVNSGEATFAGKPYENATEVICRLGTIDTFDFDGSIDLIKIDVEGFEERVLKGGQQLIKALRPLIITEVVSGHLERAGSTPEALQAIFASNNYRAYKIDLRKEGWTHVLDVQLQDGHLEDGDYIWLPSERAEETLVALNGTR